jgi:two-component system chemotaxis sensor kinase CheA
MTGEMLANPLADDSLGDFLGEARQLLSQQHKDLATLSAQVAEAPHQRLADLDVSLINDLFRSVHGIKGLSGLLGLTEINGLAHKVESVFDAARRGQLTIDAAAVEVMCRSYERLAALVEALASPTDYALDCTEIFDRIGVLLQAAGADRAGTDQPDPANARDFSLPAEMPSEQSSSEREPADFDSDVGDPFERICDEQAPAKYLAIFIDEAELSLDAMTAQLVDEQTCGSPSSTETLLITSHRIKGSAASIGLHRPAKLAHCMEDLFQDLRDTGGALQANVADVLLRCVDALRSYVHALRDGTKVVDCFPALAADLLAAHRGAAKGVTIKPKPAKARSRVATSAVATASWLTADDLTPIRRAAPLGIPWYAGRIRFGEDVLLSGMKARLLYEKLARAGNVFYCRPAAEELEDLDELGEFVFAVATTVGGDELVGQLRVSGVRQIDFLSSDDGGATFRDATLAAPTTAKPMHATTPVTGEPASPTLTPACAAEPRITTSPATTASPAPSAKSAAKSVVETARPVETLRVDIERLDQLMNLAGQLVISKSRFARLDESLRAALPEKQASQSLDLACAAVERLLAMLELHEGHSPAAESAPTPCNDATIIRGVRCGSQLAEVAMQLRRTQHDLEHARTQWERLADVRTAVHQLGDAVHQLDRVADGIQQSVMDTRMVPVGPLFTRFKRVIRDITRGNGKQIDLVIRGENTELDKRMIDELGDPLIHMIRNSADHGIEAPADREAAGKLPQGTITLEAFHRGNSIVIRVTDDGRGLDAERIRAKAVEKQIISAADAQRMSDEAALQLIWEPGFSTAEKITEISGRGMGMDIVRSKIEDLSGVAEVESKLGEGTTFTIKLPLTLAILPSLLAEIEGDVFAVPLDAVVEIVQAPSESLQGVHRRLTTCVRDRIVSVVDLNELFDWCTPARNAARDPHSATLVILGDAGREIGLVVDRLIGEEDIVVKSMADNFRNINGLAGASILGDGRVSLILDPIALVEMAGRRPAIAAAKPVAALAGA